jgi:nicotinate phosphoribosyltransferase
VRLDTPAERGRVTADLVSEVRARLDLDGFDHVRIIVSGGLTPDRIWYFKDAGAPVDFTGDLKEIDGRAIAKRGRIPGITPSPRLGRIDLLDWLSD